MTEGNWHPDTSDSTPPPDWEAFARHLAGESSPENEERIEAMLSGSPADRTLLTVLDTAISGGASDIPQDLDVEGALRKVKGRWDTVNAAPASRPRNSDVIPLRPPSRWRLPMPALAAAALLAVGVASWMSYRNRPREQAVIPAPRMLATGVGIRDSLVLADGTKVVLGPLSSLTIAGEYGLKAREVEVRGDAWFDVVHDVTKPFTVRAGNAAIVDVGTRFAVRSDAPEGVAVTVSEGAVSLRQVNTPVLQGVILKAGDNGLLGKSGHVIARRGAASDDDIAWTHGRLVFRDAPLGEVISSMHKWYGIELRAPDLSLASRHLTATFAGESADRVLEIIRLALGVDIDRRGDTAIVRPAKGSVRSR